MSPTPSKPKTVFQNWSDLLQSLEPFIPAILVTALLIYAMSASIGIDHDIARFLLLVLPFVFLVSGIFNRARQKKVRELEERIQSLECRNNTSPPA